MSVFDINPDIRRAETLSSKFYTEQEYFLESKEKIFARSWQLVGATKEMKSLSPLTVLEDFLDEPILITKDAQNRLHCLSNVCTHRGKILVETDACEANLIRCGYHGRRFALDGKFLSMPEFGGAENFPSERDDLPSISFATWKEFLFVSLNPFAPFEDFIADVRERLDWFDFDKLKFAAAQDFTVEAHWALYCENYLEGFHIPFVHHSLNEAIDYGSYQTETFRFSSLQTATAKDAENAFLLPKDSADFGRQIAAYYFFIFPNLMFNFYPWGLSVNIVKPLTAQKTKVSFLTFANGGANAKGGAGADLEAVELEDEAVVESVQKGIRSRFYENGRYSPARERGTHHFHRLITEFMK
ncbi:MAG: aromatic ring-hydroxylating dioxygenase subunit alpha [Acidobacteriota bacterium]|nr:aromatic ring-hydroxylating dioxygenase subunit alpha [Acidobacteriota bacterium]